jgi:hypothetical protein
MKASIVHRGSGAASDDDSGQHRTARLMIVDKTMVSQSIIYGERVISSR